ncbi:MAG TPA: hypothetical protein VJ756_02695 [Terriglobales bacterium]|nr:hypothetical protein [Terriglobales bacterium]
MLVFLTCISRVTGPLPEDPLLRLLNDSLLWGPVGVVLGVYLFFRGFSLLKRKRLVMNTPRSTVRAAALGPVEVSGQATGPYTLIAPLSETECFYYRLVTTHVKDRNKKQSFEQCAPFFLDDSTGKLLIDPAGAEIQFSPLGTFDSGSLPDYLRHFLVQHGISVADLVKVEEFCIRPEDRIVIFGTLQENPWPQPPEQDPVAPLGPGFLSEVAADLQHRAVFELHPTGGTRVTQSSSREFDLYPPIILAKGATPFFISTFSQQEMVKNLAFQSALYIWGGPALTLFCSYSVLQRVAMLWPR